MSSLVVTFLLFAASLGIFFGFLEPRYKGTKVLESQAAEYESTFGKIREFRKIRDELLTTYRDIPSDHLGRLEKLVPDSVDTVRLIIDISGIAESHGLILRSIDIGKTGVPDTKGAVGEDKSKYGSLSFAFNIAAPYEQFMSFLADLERSLRIIDVVGISLRTQPKPGVYDYAVSARTYWLK